MSELGGFHRDSADHGRVEVRTPPDRAPEPKPLHVWNDSDEDGHDCADCAIESMWKCDEAAHFPRDACGLLTEEERTTLDESLRADRRTRKGALIAAGRMPL